jgi:hypothetical protein
MGIQKPQSKRARRIYKTLVHRKLNIEQHEPHYNPELHLSHLSKKVG